MRTARGGFRHTFDGSTRFHAALGADFGDNRVVVASPLHLAPPDGGPPEEFRTAGMTWRRALSLSAFTLLPLLAALLAPVRRADAQGPRLDLSLTNGTVNAVALSGNTLYLGGSFSRVGAPTGSGVPLDSASGVPRSGFPRIAGQVYAVAPDGTGGWYIGGSFTSVGGVPRSNLARVLADGTLSAWNPAANNVVRALLVGGGVVIVGGDFTAIGGQSRSEIAAVDTVDGAATGWSPNANGSVYALAAGGGVVYAGGQFTSVGGGPRNRIAALDAASGEATAWNPGADATVRALAVGGQTVYAGGLFSSIGGQSRGRIAALDAGTGLATTWNPNANGSVYALALSGETVYAAGLFGSIGGQSRERIAALDAGTGLATTWNPNANGTVYSLAVSGGTVYAGGDFLSIGGQSRGRIAAVNAGTGLATAWDPSAYSTVLALAVGPGTVFAGGSFGSVGGVVRNNVAALDLSSGLATTWNPDGNGEVLALEMSGGTVFVGGSFTSIGGQPRNRIAALDASSGLATPWNPNADGQVLALEAGAGVVYAGGAFTRIGGQARNDIAALDLTSGLATGWDPDANDLVVALVVNGATLYVGGNFSRIGGQWRNDLAALDVTTGLAAGWNPNPNGTIRSLALTCGTVYAGGFFTVIGGRARAWMAALDAATGYAYEWNPTANGPVYGVVVRDGVVYSGGIFSLIGGQPRNRLAALDPATGLATPWNPNANGIVRALAVGDGEVYAGGGFSLMGGQPLSNVAAIAADQSLTCPAITLVPPPLPPGVVDTAYSQSVAASGGTPPYCYAVTAGALPPGLALDGSAGAIQGVPTTAGAYPFTVGVSDAHGCAGDRTYVLSVFSTPAQSFVAAHSAGLCISTAHPCVSVPFLFERSDSVPARAMSVTFKIDVSKLSLCTPASPAASIHPGSWLAGFSRSFQVIDNGGGSYKVDQVILGSPCGVTVGGQLFTVDLKSVDGDGSGALTVTEVSARDCSNGPIAALPGPVDSLAILNTPIAILPDTLPSGPIGVAYSQTFTATAGVGPFTFTLLAGALPPGLTLSAGGILAGMPETPGTSSFTVGVVDSRGCPGSHAYSLTIVCSPVAFRPTVLPNGAVGVAYGQTLTATTGRAPCTFALISGVLPQGLSLSAGGDLSGTPIAAGTSNFAVGVTDANGCTGSRSYPLTIFATPPQSSVAADAGGDCITRAHACVNVPFVFTRAESLPARAMSVTFQIDLSKLSLCTPTTPAASVHVGTWLAAFARSFQVTDNGGGSYTVDQVILGAPCGATAGGQLFTADLKSVGDDGSGTVTVMAVNVRDCGNVPIPAASGAPAAITIDNLGPAEITDLVASRVTAGVDSGSTTRIMVTWSTGGAGTVSLYRAPFGSYPEYDDDGPVSPPSPSAAPGPPWTLVAANAASGYVDHAAPRGFWYYVALVTDGCGAVSMASSMTPGILNYHLGDVSDGYTPGQGDNRVRTEDVSLLGANYGIGDADITARHVEYLDVGPTTDGLPTSRPTPDDWIDIEDLMIFALNYGVATGPRPAAPQASARAVVARDEFLVQAPSLVEPGQTVTAGLTLRGAGRIQGFSARLGWDATVVEPREMRPGPFIEAQNGVVLSPRPGTVDAALLGVREQGITGEGLVASVTFRVLRAGDPAIRVAGVLARDAANRAIDGDAIEQSVRRELPGQTTLLQPSPNPFREEATLTFSLARAGPVALAVYSVDGRRVRTLLSEWREAGVYHVTWNGVDDGHHLVAPGVFYVHFSTAGRQFTKRLVYLR